MAWNFNLPRPAAYPRLRSPDGTIHHMPRRFDCLISGQFVLDITGNWDWVEDVGGYVLDATGYQYLSNGQVGSGSTVIDSGDVTQGGDFDNTTDPLTIVDFGGRYLLGHYWVGQTIQIGSEKLRVVTYYWPEITFERGVDGTTVSRHPDGETIWILLPTDSETLRYQIVARGQQGETETYLRDTLILENGQSPLTPSFDSGVFVYSSTRWTVATGYGIVPRVRLQVGLFGHQYDVFNFRALLAYHVGLSYPVATLRYSELIPVHADYTPPPGNPLSDWVPPFLRLRPCDSMSLITPPEKQNDEPGLHTMEITPVWL